MHHPPRHPVSSAPRPPGFSRRAFLGGVGGTLAVGTGAGAGRRGQPHQDALGRALADAQTDRGTAAQPLDLAPAKWIWFPSARTLANTFVLFRRELLVTKALTRATGWITADSRYRLSVNGRRIQWGPAPCDPRFLEADPVDLTTHLAPRTAGRGAAAAIVPRPAVLGAEVLFYGSGDGTWPLGKPGFLFRLDLEYADGSAEQVLSDDSWLCTVDRSHRPGQYRRWFLRALQEEIDWRRKPRGWDATTYTPALAEPAWVPAMVLGNTPSRPALASNYPDYSWESGLTDPGAAQLRARRIPMLAESLVPAKGLAESGRVHWRRDPEDWFEFRTPGLYDITRGDTVTLHPDGGWQAPATPGPRNAVFATFEWPEQLVGWPRVLIDAPPGTVVELIAQESHDPAKAAWLDTHYYQWSRHVCREGPTELEPFDFESFRWLQVHVRNATGVVRILEVGARRRVFPWPNPPAIACAEAPLQKLFEAAVNTLNNSAQETCVDGMGRERQQYSGDGGHQLHPVRQTFGETRLPARFLETFSQGLSPDGYFMDCWPAFDRLARVMEKQVGASYWGPLLDHGVGFVFDCYHHYMQTGDLEALREPYPRLLRFTAYLAGLPRENGLLPVEGLGVPNVWIDHEAYRAQRDKRCAFNLYVAAMLRHALAPLARAFGDQRVAGDAETWSDALTAAAAAAYWDQGTRLYVNNLPRSGPDGGPRLCDRSLATAILCDQCPGNRAEAAVAALADAPPNLGLSYPCNAVWRLWALGKAGRVDAVLNELRTRWATMASVRLNNTIQEFWNAPSDSTALWSHCAVAPLIALHQILAGVAPESPGYASLTVRPQPGDLPSLDVTTRTPRGPVRVESRLDGTTQRVRVTVPQECEASVLLPEALDTTLQRTEGPAPAGTRRYRLIVGGTTELMMPLTPRGR